VTTTEEIQTHLAHVDGVMLGREAYHRPWWLTEWDEAFFGDAPSTLTRDEVEAELLDYMAHRVAAGEPWSRVARHMLGLRNGLPGARKWRQVWSDHRLKNETPAKVSALAQEAWRAAA
jgi:tRNA-dihydrouridine synthase A